MALAASSNGKYLAAAATAAKGSGSEPAAHLVIWALGRSKVLATLPLPGAAEEQGPLHLDVCFSRAGVHGVSGDMWGCSTGGSSPQP